MRCRIAVIVMLLTPCILSDAQVIKGRITDNAGIPMPAASVYIPELRQGSTTNNEGHYEITLPPGSYTITYRFLGYTPVTKVFTLTTEDIVADITLSEQLFEIPPVRISASGKDPAYFIMRKAIGMAPFHLNQSRYPVKASSAPDVYFSPVALYLVKVERSHAYRLSHDEVCRIFSRG